MDTPNSDESHLREPETEIINDFPISAKLKDILDLRPNFRQVMYSTSVVTLVLVVVNLGFFGLLGFSLLFGGDFQDHITDFRVFVIVFMVLTLIVFCPFIIGYYLLWICCKIWEDLKSRRDAEA